MRDSMKKIILGYICFLVLFCFLPIMSWARLSVQADVVSATIAEIYEDNSVKLDNGKIYYPSRDGLAVDLPVGAPVTLRIVKEVDKDVFFEFLSGFNSLKKLDTPPSKRDTRPN